MAVLAAHRKKQTVWYADAVWLLSPAKGGNDEVLIVPALAGILVRGKDLLQ